MTTLLSRLTSWFCNGPPSVPSVPSVAIRVLRVPADGSAPHIQTLRTIDISADENVDCFLAHVPDMREFWGTGEGWQWRDLAQCEIADQNPVLNGVYYAWKSFAGHLLPLNKDVFIAKLMLTEHDEHGWAAYDNVPDALLDSGLYKRVLERLAES